MKRIIYFLYNQTAEGKHHIGFIRFLIRLWANILVYLLQWIKPHAKNEEPRIIVSMTSFPGRINIVWKTLLTLIHQQATVPFKVILWLSKEQFNDLDALPCSLKRLVRSKGLEINIMDDDLKPHKKYFYTFKKYPEHIVITVDDDILYSLDLIQTLYDAHMQSPDMVCCCRGRKVAFDDNGNACGYEKWKIMSSSQESTISRSIVPTGIGGVLYPPNSYSKEIFNEKALKSTCLNGDDLWLNFMCRQQGTVVQHIKNCFRYNTLFSSQKGSLSKSNVKLNKNDEQIKLISNWARESLDCDFFYNMKS